MFSEQYARARARGGVCKLLTTRFPQGSATDGREGNGDGRTLADGKVTLRVGDHRAGQLIGNDRFVIPRTDREFSESSVSVTQSQR